MGSSAAANRLGFVGVTASRSSINRVFPRWGRVLSLGEVRFEPVDLPLDAPSEAYRKVVAEIRDDPKHRGALVTTHKVRLLEATADLFDELDPHAERLGEVSCISKRGRRLRGHAKDPVTAGQAMDDFLPRGHFERTDAEVVCLGAGGAGLAIATTLMVREPADDRPSRLVLVDRDPRRLDWCRHVLGQLGGDVSVRIVVNEDPEHNDRLVATAQPGSLVINATGLGKDAPGAPVTSAVHFPEGGLVWELNYRGELDLLHLAHAQADARHLHVEDGWNYFIYGWSAVVAETFDIDIDEHTLRRLSDEAAEVRS